MESAGRVRSNLWIRVAFGMASLAFAGCKSTDEKLREALVASYEGSFDWASSLCGYEASSLTHVTVTEVTHEQSGRNGNGTARVSGVPVAANGAPVGSSCSGPIRFEYATLGGGGSVRLSSRGRRGRGSNGPSRVQIDRITVVSRTGSVPPGAVPFDSLTE